MSELLEFRHFKYLIAVAEEENISRAAKRLFLAQPSLSIQLKSIEDALSIELLVRVPKGVKLTPAAQVLIAGARQILALRDEVVAAAQASHHGTIAPLRIGFSPFIDCALLQMVCSAHLALFPNCEITPKSGDSVELLSLLERGVIDAALLPLPAIGIDLNIDELGDIAFIEAPRFIIGDVVEPFEFRGNVGEPGILVGCQSTCRLDTDKLVRHRPALHRGS